MNIPQRFLLLLSGPSLAAYIRGLQPAMWLPLTETSGSIATNVMYSGGVGPQLFANPGVIGSGAYAGGSEFTFTADNPDEWNIPNESAPDPEVSEVGTGEGHGGSGTGLMNVFSSSALIQVNQNPILTVGDTYINPIDIDTRTAGALVRTIGGSGSLGSNISAAGVNTHTFIATATDIGLKRGTGSGDDLTVRGNHVRKIGELDGLYIGQTLGGDTLLGQPAPTFDGINDYVQLEYNRLESVFDPDDGTMVFAVKLSAAQWADANQYYAATIGVDANNRMVLLKSGANAFQFTSLINGVQEAATSVVSSALHGKWVLMIGTWNTSANQLKLYTPEDTQTDTFDGSAWTVTALTAAWSRLGTRTATLFWPNAMGQGILFDRAITASEVATLYNLFKAQEPNAA